MLETKLLSFTQQHLTEAGTIIRQGGLVAFPTETVYGLGANALDANAVSDVFRAKGRPSDNPLIVHVYCKEQIYEIANSVSDDALKVIDHLMPGSVTIVLPKKADVVPDCVTAGLATVAVRMPLSQEARQFLQYCKVPVAAPSANTSTRPSPTTWQAVNEDMSGKIDAILCGKACDVGIESTVLDLTSDTPRILRPGIVTASQIEAIIGKSVVVITNPKEKVNSPGVRYKHYAPKCDMVLNLDGDIAKLCNYYDQCVEKGQKPVLLVQDVAKYGNRQCYPLGETDEQVAHNLFAALRHCEKRYDIIIASYTGKGEVADSVINRITKSAGQKII